MEWPLVKSPTDLDFVSIRDGELKSKENDENLERRRKFWREREERLL